MRNSNNNGRCEKQTFSKHTGICRTYSRIQRAYAQMLEADDNITEFRCNVPVVDFVLTDGAYTTDFVCTLTSGDVMVRECVERNLLTRPSKIKMLDASREYWADRGVTDWGLVIDA